MIYLDLQVSRQCMRSRLFFRKLCDVSLLFFLITKSPQI
jgi:hypothetical protein